MASNTNLVTSYNFRGREYLVNLKLINLGSRPIDISVTDKKTSEQWRGSFDSSYVENLTVKTGNFKRFDIFISMLKSGLLGTSQCVTLDLLTFEDLEILRSRVSDSRNVVPNSSSNMFISNSNNKRYLIVTYTVEFDRIHYPLALEYCGPPDPKILQDTINRLERQIVDLQQQMNGSDWSDIKIEIDTLQKKVVDVTTENIMLKDQIKQLTLLEKNKYSSKHIDTLLKYTCELESKLKNEILNTDKLKKDNYELSMQLEESLKAERSLRAELNRFKVDQDASLKRKDDKFQRKFHSLSPKKNRMLENCAEKPFSRHRSQERRMLSARSSLQICHSSSEDSIIANYGKSKLNKHSTLSPRNRASSPSFSDISHHSNNSRCACRNCLRSKFIRKENQSFNFKKQRKELSKTKLLRRIQSLEKLISGIVLN